MPLLTLLGQVSLSKTIGGTTQLGGLSSTGGLNVFSTITVGGTDQLGTLSSTGGLQVNSTLTIGGTDQLGLITSTGTIQVGEVADGGGIPPHKRKKYRQEEYRKAFYDAKYRKEQKEAIEAAVREERAEQEKGKTLKLKKKSVKLDISQKEVEQLASIENHIDRMLAIEYQLNYLEFKRKEDEALAVLLLIS